MANETVAERYDREYLNLKDDRKVRTFDYKDEERRTREFVDADTGNTVSDVLDNTPAGFDRAEFENSLAHNPSVATGAVAGSPGTFTPTGAHTPADLAALGDVTADPETLWTVGQHVVLADASEAHWDGTAWAAGQAPA